MKLGPKACERQKDKRTIILRNNARNKLVFQFSFGKNK